MERSPLPEILTYQNLSLKGVLNYLNNYSPYYSQLFTENRIDISKIISIGDLSEIPLTTKKELQLRNHDFLCVKPEKVIDYITTSGTQGDPVTFALTENDLERLAYNEAISFACADSIPGDIYQLMTTMDRRFMAGLAYFLGIRKLQAGIVRAGSGLPGFQWDTINRIKPTAFITVPSFILKIIEFADSNGIEFRNSSIKKAVCIGESLRNEDFSLNTLGTKITAKWPLKLYSTYASTEMATSFAECREGKGGHHHPELVIAEFLDHHGKPVNEGEPGELTITTLGIEGMPLLRFSTGDICRHYQDPCACGRTTLRIGPIIGRKDHMIKFKGTTLYPSMLYDVLENIDYIDNYLVEVSTNELGTDQIMVRVGSKKAIYDQENKIKDHFRSKLRVAPDICFEDTETIMKIQFPESGRKAIKFIDHRRSYS
ncbi:MAG: AMP-binding protein [Bacteroidota bacterium]